MRYVLDTTAFSALMRREYLILQFLKSHTPGDIRTVPPVVAEIFYGIERLKKGSRKYRLLKAEAERILSVLEVLPWTHEASLCFGAIKSDLERRGVLIDDLDIAIASISIAHGCCVVTKNLRHFSRINGLKSRDWEQMREQNPKGQQ